LLFVFFSKQKGFVIKTNWFLLSIILLLVVSISLPFWLMNIPFITSLMIKISIIIVAGLISYKLYFEKIRELFQTCLGNKYILL